MPLVRDIFGITVAVTAPAGSPWNSAPKVSPAVSIVWQNS